MQIGTSPMQAALPHGRSRGNLSKNAPGIAGDVEIHARYYYLCDATSFIFSKLSMRCDVDTYCPPRCANANRLGLIAGKWGSVTDMLFLRSSVLHHQQRTALWRPHSILPTKFSPVRRLKSWTIIIWWRYLWKNFFIPGSCNLSLTFAPSVVIHLSVLPTPKQ